MNRNRMSIRAAMFVVAILPVVSNSLAADEPRMCFTAHFACAADGTEQPIVIQLPADFSPEKSYPLLIYISYSLPTAETLPPSGKPYFKVHITGHKMLAFPGLADHDVLAVIDMMKREYPVDERRVFLNGFSAGGSAVMVIASRHPDRFAGAIPLGAFGNNAVLDNLFNLPVFCHHGQKDWTSSIDNVRVYFQQLRALGAPALLKEYPNVGHSVGNPVNMDGWLMAQQRNDRPQRVLYRCDSPDQGRAYWVEIRKFDDIHRDARVSARHDETGDQQTLIVQADNIDVLQVAFDRSPVDREQPLVIQANEDQLRLAAPLPTECVLVRGAAGWSIASEWQPPAYERRAYRPGSAANLYGGEPLLVVYGTQSSDAARTAGLKRIAEELSRCGGPFYQALSQGFPVKADRDVTGQDMSHYNLLLVGEAADNLLVGRMTEHFPFAVSESRELAVAGRANVPLDDAVFGFSYFNPLAPQRFVYVFAPHLATPELAQLNGKCARMLPGADGLRKGDQPDLVVQSVDRVQRCHVQFDQHWQWLHSWKDSDRETRSPPATCKSCGDDRRRISASGGGSGISCSTTTTSIFSIAMILRGSLRPTIAARRNR